MEQILSHEDTFEKKHTKDLEWYHPSKSHIFEHDGKLKTSMFSSFMFCASKPQKYRCCNEEAGERGCVEKWSCCKEKLTNEGCQRRYICCQRDIGKSWISYSIANFLQIATAISFHFLADSSDLGCENIYKCCGKDIRNPGCVKICKKCGAPWGTPAKNCFKKDHELEPIEIEV